MSRASLYYLPADVSAKELALRGASMNSVRPIRSMDHGGFASSFGAKGRRSTARAFSARCRLRNLSSGWPDHIWGIDITYIRLPHGWLYLVAVLDWFSRYVLSWELDQTLGTLLGWRCRSF